MLQCLDKEMRRIAHAYNESASYQWIGTGHTSIQQRPDNWKGQAWRFSSVSCSITTSYSSCMNRSRWLSHSLVPLRERVSTASSSVEETNCIDAVPCDESHSHTSCHGQTDSHDSLEIDQQLHEQRSRGPYGLRGTLVKKSISMRLQLLLSNDEEMLRISASTP